MKFELFSNGDSWARGCGQNTPYGWRVHLVDATCRLAVAAVLVGCLVAPASATPVFNKEWKAKFLGSDADENLVSAAKKAKCNVCHVNRKNKKKDEGKNEYGKAISKFLSAKDFKTAKVRANPKEAREKILAGFEEANKLESKDGEVFGAKIKAGELPATDAGLKK